MRMTHRLVAPVLTALLAVSGSAFAKPKTVSTVTGPQAGLPTAIAQQYLDAQHETLGLTAADLAEATLRDQHRSSRSGVTHLYYHQAHDGIEVWNGILSVHVMPDGSILRVTNNFVADLAGQIENASPRLSAEDAVSNALDHIGVELREPLVQLEASGAASQALLLSDGGVSRAPIPARLVWQPVDGAVTLAWQVQIDRLDASSWLNVRIDAATGAVLDQNDYIAHVDEYRVYPLPAESPNDGPHTLVNAPADPIASPFGWHDTNGVAGGEFTDTRGNNVFAQEDQDDNNSGGFRPSGGAGPDLSFDFAHDDQNLEPTEGTNIEAAIVNLFYFNNIMHDVTYQYGFDEAAGNFQENNYGGGGAGSDAVNADALDGSGTNNANFGTPPDGSNPRMQMFIWTSPAQVVVNSPPAIAGDYGAGGANFGPGLDDLGVTGDLALAIDNSTDDTQGGNTGTFTDGCQPFVGFPAGDIALIDRGSCAFVVKVKNAQNAGAIAAVVINNQGDEVITMGGTDATITIPSAFVGQTDGASFKAELQSGDVNVRLSSVGVSRDSDLDNGIIGHEYGHGISNRLVGGPSNASCLFGNEQMGEGMSDFWALVLHAQATDTAKEPRGIGNYVEFFARTGPGIRNFPYSTSLAVNPQTLADISSTNVPHGVGEIWMTAVWELYWELVQAYGFDPDLYTGTGGNNEMIELFIEHMKLVGCGPTFEATRDAFLAADLALNGGANQCAIWRSFAKRGVGVNADSGNTSVGDEVEDFTVPNGCEATSIFIDGFESGGVSGWDIAVGYDAGP